MWTNTLFDTLRKSLRRFRRSERGNVMITFALATIPMIGLVGAAVDYSRGNSAKAAMQAAADATALMLSKNVSSLNSADLNQKATAYFAALLHRPEVSDVAVMPTYTTTAGTQLRVSATGKMPTTFLKVLGRDNLNIDVSSTVAWGNARLRVALVLDVTGSMASSGKIEALRTATNNLLKQLQSAAAQVGDVYVSIIPFSKDVNVDAVNYNASWIDWTDWEDYNGACYNNAQFNGNPNNYDTRTSCQGNSKHWKPADHSTWNGCITDRGNSQTPNAGNYDTNVSPPASNTGTLFPAEQYNSCPQRVMPLSYNWSAMTTLVNSLSPNGNTNQGIGLAHGWMSLVGGGPYPPPPAMDPNYSYTQVIILMSDGLNTQNRWYSDGSSIDAREAITCANAKAAGITIYAIQVNTSGDPLQNVMRNCASSPDKFVMLTSASQLVTTFQQIGTSLSKLRVAM
jgi:Flp pilus assembly protein TadG